MFAVIQRWRATPLEYGTTDCCRFVGECLKSLRGENPMDALDHDYSYAGERAALKLIRKHGSLPGLISSVLGPEKVGAPVDGDVVTVTNGGREIVGIVWFDKIILRTDNGVTDWPIELAEHVWVS